MACGLYDTSVGEYRRPGRDTPKPGTTFGSLSSIPLEQFLFTGSIDSEQKSLETDVREIAGRESIFVVHPAVDCWIKDHLCLTWCHVHLGLRCTKDKNTMKGSEFPIVNVISVETRWCRSFVIAIVLSDELLMYQADPLVRQKDRGRIFRFLLGRECSPDFDVSAERSVLQILVIWVERGVKKSAPGYKRESARVEIGSDTGSVLLRLVTARATAHLALSSPRISCARGMTQLAYSSMILWLSLAHDCWTITHLLKIVLLRARFVHIAARHVRTRRHAESSKAAKQPPRHKKRGAVVGSVVGSTSGWFPVGGFGGGVGFRHTAFLGVVLECALYVDTCEEKVTKRNFDLRLLVAGRGGQLLEVTCGISRTIGASDTSSQTNNERVRSVSEVCTVAVVYVLGLALSQLYGGEGAGTSGMSSQGNNDHRRMLLQDLVAPVLFNICWRILIPLLMIEVEGP
ncbi:hypothetical protein Tco_0472495 [Tanacetum coccineum]